MKFLRYRDGGEARYGILEGDTVYAASGDPFSGLTRGDAVGELDSLELLTPVQPGKVMAIGLNYALHITESDPNRTAPDEPVVFMKPISALLPHGGAIELPDAPRVDYEAELVIVMGTRAKGVAESDALDYVLGYTCGNDVSHRAFQRKDGQWVRAKGHDTFCPLGPVVETELDASSLRIQSRLNGEVRQDSNTEHLIFNVPFLISFISGFLTLEPGDVIMTGTPEGVGPMSPGDTIEVEVEGIGTLRNTTRARD